MHPNRILLFIEPNHVEMFLGPPDALVELPEIVLNNGKASLQTFVLGTSFHSVPFLLDMANQSSNYAFLLKYSSPRATRLQQLYGADVTKIPGAVNQQHHSNRDGLWGCKWKRSLDWFCRFDSCFKHENWHWRRKKWHSKVPSCILSCWFLMSLLPKTTLQVNSKEFKEMFP